MKIYGHIRMIAGLLRYIIAQMAAETSLTSGQQFARYRDLSTSI